MEKYLSEDFIEKFSERVKGSVFDHEMNRIRTKINRVLQKENLYFDEECYLVLQSENKETENKICNFFVLPTHTLYYDDDEKLHEAGIALELYSQIEEDKYKRILLNLNDEAIEKGNWLNNISFFDRDYLVYKSDLYRYLRIAIKLSTRILKENQKKVFYDDAWLEDDDALEHISAFKYDQRMLQLRKYNNELENDTNRKEDIDAINFLTAQSKYISEITMLAFPEDPSVENSEWGWEDNEYYYLVYSKTWSWIRAFFNHNEIKLKLNEKELDDYLIEAGVFESNEIRPKTKIKRADRKTPPLKQRVFMINKLRLHEFLSHKEN
ncbi:hypothetical protein PCCS19_36020 [Paenibacillus sp. CCS19]|uniref:hypothetical protein n=1 Tax=Paenibacillus sp. CCS19 TaxID=3158387 RepID=UPI0025654CD1|nr:hypothetical protein [Paenibacillus cellulosilyticus]GMK40546.1 hypothetical protein PCCS19_36020 [Paenibacillus cellulosilyticus]